MAGTALLERNPDPDEDEIREYLSGNVCRCTGYMGIVDAVKTAAAARRDRATTNGNRA
jgi:carbon-monoxide dehydrogenase small subunit